MLQTHFPNRPSTGDRRAKFWKFERLLVDFRSTFRPIVADVLVGRQLLVEAPKLKVSLTDSSLLRGFDFGEASGDDRPMINGQLTDFLMTLTSGY